MRPGPGCPRPVNPNTMPTATTATVRTRNLGWTGCSPGTISSDAGLIGMGEGVAGAGRVGIRFSQGWEGEILSGWW